MSSPISKNKVNVVIDEDLLEKFRREHSLEPANDLVTDQAEKIFKPEVNHRPNPYVYSFRATVPAHSDEQKTVYVPYSLIFSYCIQYKIYDWLDKFTQNSEWVRLPALPAVIVGNLVELVGIVASVAEVFFHGLGGIFISPLYQDSSEKFHRSWEILKTTPYHMASILGLLILSIEATVLWVSEPRWLVYIRNERITVNKYHAEAGTLGTKVYKSDANIAAKTAYGRLLTWQDPVRFGQKD